MSSASEDDIERVRLARALANPSKETRDEAIASLNTVISKQSSFSELGMEKLWKALYYCMWLADKAQVQQDLAESLANLLFSFQNDVLKKMFLVAFYRTLLREWGQLDQYRINKFYSLIRIMFRKLFTYLHTLGWSPKITRQVMEDLEREVLTKTPNGLRFHIADIFLPELLATTSGEITTKQFLRCIKPFLNGLCNADEVSYQQRIIKRIFTEFLSSYAVEVVALSSSTAKNGFRNVKTCTLQGAVFDAASLESTKDSYRTSIYALHKLFQRTTGIQFYSPDNANSTIEERATVVPTNSAPLNGIDPGHKKSKSVASTDGLPSESSTFLTAVSGSLMKKSKDKKRVIEEEQDSNKESSSALFVGSEDNADSHRDESSTDDVVKKKKSKKNKKVPSSTIEQEEQDSSLFIDDVHIQIDDEVVIRKKRKVTDGSVQPLYHTVVGTSQSDSIDSSSSTSNNAFAKKVKEHKDKSNIDGNVVNELCEADSGQLPAFVPSKSFQGARIGFKFQTGEFGLGYYVDNVLSNAADSVQSKKKAKAKRKAMAMEREREAQEKSAAKLVAMAEIQQKVHEEAKKKGKVANPDADRRLSTGSQEERRVRFGTPKSIDYKSSVSALKAATPNLNSTPSKSALKVRLSLDGLDGSTPGKSASAKKKGRKLEL